MNTASQRPPPRFVPTLTEVVEAPALPVAAMPLPVSEHAQAPLPPVAPPVPQGEVRPIDVSALLDQKINDWLDQWLAEQAPLLLEQMLARLAVDLRQSLQRQALQAVAQAWPEPVDPQSEDDTNG